MRGPLVILRANRIGELLVEGPADVVPLTDALPHLFQPPDEFVLGVLVGSVIPGEQVPESIEASVDLVDRQCGPLLLEGGQRPGLDAVEEHERTILLMRKGPFVVGRMFLHEIHEREAVVGIASGATVFPQREPADAPVVVLHEFPVGLDALLAVETERIA